MVLQVTGWGGGFGGQGVGCGGSKGRKAKMDILDNSV